MVLYSLVTQNVSPWELKRFLAVLFPNPSEDNHCSSSAALSALQK